MTTASRAVLAMDSYVSDQVPTDIAGITLLHSVALGNGFYASAYQTDEGIYIAYRGTSAMPEDLTGFPAATGIVDNVGSQTRFAFESYNSIKDQYPNEIISLTGHSLGGGLAGIVGAVTGVNAFLFDQMPFHRVRLN